MTSTRVSGRPRAALYLRVSTFDQHVDNQAHELQAFAAARGWVVAGEFSDRGVSGSKDRRPALDRLTADPDHAGFARGVASHVFLCRFDLVKDTPRGLEDAAAGGGKQPCACPCGGTRASPAAPRWRPRCFGTTVATASRNRCCTTPGWRPCDNPRFAEILRRAQARRDEALAVFGAEGGERLLGLHPAA